MVTALQLDTQVSRGADDDAVLTCALAAKATLIAPGDDDLLVLKAFNSIPITTAAQAIRPFVSTPKA